MGEVGDTILTVMQTADTIAEPWQVLGDYIRPYSFASTTELKIENDTLKGLVSGYNFAPPQYQVHQLSFNDFINYWNSHGSSCNTLVSIEEKEELQALLFPNPANAILYLEGIEEVVYVKLYSAQGDLVLSSSFRNNQIDIASLPPGVYTAMLSADKKVAIRKVIKVE
jgi:hypothetical protein